MGILQKFKTLFNRYNHNEFGAVEFAFRHNGVNYYCFKDVNNMPAERALMVFVFYNELDMRCNRQYLLDFKKSLDACINGKFLRTDVAQLSVHLGERLEISLETELLMKLASVYYFDKTENLAKYDFAYAHEKIKKWKQGDVNSFFLQKRIGELIDLRASSNLDFQAYSQGIEEIKKIHQEFLQELQSNNNSTIGSAKS